MRIDMGYVSKHGNWGTEEVLVFNDAELTEAQWENLDILPDSEKMAYVDAIIDGQDLSEWEDADA
jgi:hypothetical protein